MWQASYADSMGAVEATFSTKSMVEEAVAKLPKVTLDEAQDLLDETDRSTG